MPLFALIGRDGPGSAELRKQHRPAHLEHLRPLVRAGRVRFAGPLLERGAPVGSLVVFEAEDLAAARVLATSDPYVVQGVFASHEVRETRDVRAELAGEEGWAYSRFHHPPRGETRMPTDPSGAAAPRIDPGDIAGWPILKIDYRTDPERIAALLPPGIDPGRRPHVHLSIYNFPVPDEPEYGIVVGVDADHKGQAGVYALGYGIDQESAIFISRDMNGQPKYPCSTTYYRMGRQVTARCSHQGYTFVEFRGEVKGAVANPPDHVENEWWIKVSRAVGGAEKSYDFPPHVVRVKSSYRTIYQETVAGTLTLRESPWDPIAELLPLREQLGASLWTPMPLGREITLETPLDPDAFWPHVDTIGGSRWPGERGGPRRRR